MLKRAYGDNFCTREEEDKKYIRGYFAVFDSPYYVCGDCYETIARGAFASTLVDGDIRALINHDTSLVIGRTTANTLTLAEDEKGLYGEILINPNDTDALNIYERVKRGDVSQCSFGFDILNEETEFIENSDAIHWTIKAVKLYEVSVVTFPAYEETYVSARFKSADKMRENQAWKIKMHRKLKGGA